MSIEGVNLRLFEGEEMESVLMVRLGGGGWLRGREKRMDGWSEGGLFG